MKKLVLMMLALMIVLMGCSSNEGAGGTDKGKDDKVTLRYSRWGTPEEIKGTQEIINKFNSEHANIEVKLEYADWGNYWTKLQTQQAGGTAPDVFLLDSAFYLGTFAEKNAIQDLTPYVEKTKLDLNQFLPGLTSIHTYKDKLYALPRDLNSIIMYYNKTLFEKAKLEVPNGKWTWDQALAAAQKLTLDKNGKTADQPDFDPKSIVQYGLFLNDQNVDSTVEAMIVQNGGHMFNGDNTGTTLETPESQQVLTFLNDLVNKYHVSPSGEMVANMGTPFATGKVAMTMDGSWMLPEYNKTQGFEWDVTLPPIYKKQAMAVQSVGNSMAAKTKYPDQAWELIRYLSGEEAQKIMAKEGASIPALKSVAESDFLQGAPSNRKAFLDATEYGFPQPWFPGRAEVIDLMAQEFKSYMTNIKKIDEIVKKVDKDSQEKIKAGK